MNVQVRNIHFSSGQALAELIIACAILAIILFGVVTTINYSINSVAVAANKTRATYYAEQGLEQARVARNTDWTTFAGANSGTTYLNGENNMTIAGTPYQRTIAITNDTTVTGDNDRRVRSAVTWTDGTQQYTTELVTVLTNR